MDVADLVDMVLVCCARKRQALTTHNATAQLTAGPRDLHRLKDDVVVLLRVLPDVAQCVVYKEIFQGLSPGAIKHPRSRQHTLEFINQRAEMG